MSGKAGSKDPAERFRARDDHVIQAFSTGAATAVLYDLPERIQVNGDVTRDIALPDTAVYPVSGEVAGMAILTGGAYRVAFSTRDAGIFAWSQLGADNRYQARLPAGTYAAGLHCMGLTSPSSSSYVHFPSFLNIGSVKVENGAVSANLAVPAAAKISGGYRADLPGAFAYPSYSFMALDSEAVALPQLAMFGMPPGSLGYTQVPGRYEVLVGAGRSYRLSMNITAYAGSIAQITCPASTAPLEIKSDTSFDFNPGRMPDAVRLRGRVTDADGRGVKDVTVNAYTESIGGTGGATYTVMAITDINGEYFLTVLRGTGYQVTFAPRQPQP